MKGVDLQFVNDDPVISGSIPSPDTAGAVKPDKPRTLGLIHHIDNPVAIHSSVVALSLYGVKSENMVIMEDAADILNDISVGDVIVVNSLYDLSSKKADIIDIIIEILEKGASVVTLEAANSSEAITGESSAIQLLKLLRSHREATRAVRQMIGTESSYTEDRNFIKHRPGKPDGSVSPAQQAKYDKALRIYHSGASMQKATQMAGCNYSSFWYWYNKQYLKNDRRKKRLFGI